MNSERSPVVVVTGGTAGIGRATVREFARQGYDVAILARGKDGLEAAKREVEAMGQRALAIPTDVAQWSMVEDAAETIERELGPINVWVNNAFAGIFSRFIDVSPEEYERVTQVTYIGQVNGTRAALARMLPRNRGKIVLVGSALAYRGIPLQSAYCGAKHAIQGFIDSLRCELLHSGTQVTITMVQMPGVNTPSSTGSGQSFQGNRVRSERSISPKSQRVHSMLQRIPRGKEMLVGLRRSRQSGATRSASSLHRRLSRKNRLSTRSSARNR